MTWVGIYLVVVYIIGLASYGYYISKGEVTLGRGTLIFSALWSVVNLVLILTVGTGHI